MDPGRVMERAGGLPAAAIARRVNDALRECGAVVVTAPPGAGKSTLLPLTILQEAGSGKVLMLEPRRLAARQIAERMAWLLDEPVGRTAGYRVRFESRVSDATRVEVLTEGILTRMLVEDPTLEGVSTVIFDEFHERSLNCDLALALVRQTRNIIRPDLRIVIMSATIETDAICRELDAPLVAGEGKMYPVEIVDAAVEATPENATEAVAQVIRRAHREHDGDILAFLPGEADIRRCAELLGNSLGETEIHPLYGMLPPEAQRRAIAPGEKRKVVLATPIAETSLTIENVRIVIDSGLCRKSVFNPQSGLSRLETVRISRDMARQRAGRAGRVAPGTCYRLWGLAADTRMEESRKPEILEADLAQTVLAIASWGEGAPEDLPWVTPPPAASLRHARRLLTALGAIDAAGGITASGREMAALPCHPRIAHMLCSAEGTGLKALAADIAALLEEKDPMSRDGAGADLAERVSALRASRRNRREGRAWSRISLIAGQYCALVRVPEDNTDPDPYSVGALVAAAYPERVARSADAAGRFQLAGGGSAFLDRDDALSSYGWLAVANLNAREGGDGRIFLAAPLDPEDLGALTAERDNVAWDSRQGAVVARRETRIGGLVISSVPIGNIPGEEIERIICEAVAKEGISMLDFSREEVGNLQRRVAAVAAWHPELELPDLSTEAVLACAGQWLPPFLGRATTVQELKKIDVEQALWSLLDYSQQQAVDRLAPTHITVPTGSHIRVEYRLGAEAPVLRVRLQECFGLTDTPRVDDGRRPVLMELLSPGFKPVQLTQDLRSFWQDTYFEVRKDLRRRYPKHSWPDNPLAADPVRGVGRKH